MIALETPAQAGVFFSSGDAIAMWPRHAMRFGGGAFRAAGIIRAPFCAGAPVSPI